MKYLILLILLTGCGVRSAGPKTVMIKANTANVTIISTLDAPKEVDAKTDLELPLIK